jgi:YidC/Oxa1 family membrane protein insertase
MFPEITLPFLYLEALNQPDPYYLLPVSFAYLTYLNIALSPNSGSSLTPPVIKLFMKYLRYIPFFSLPVVCFFPSGICLYWFCNSASQLALLLLFKTSFFKNLMLPPIKV